MKFKIVIILYITIISVSKLFSSDYQRLYNRIKPYINEKCSIKIVAENETIISINAETKLKPASILKILSSYYFLKMLGENFRFYTDFYYDGKNLYLKGYGDPMFISEEIEKIAIKIAKVKGSFEIIYIDSSFFEKPVIIPGVGNTLRPYDTQNGAIVSNFNTINVNISKSNITSAEPQTPMTPFSEQIAKKSRLRGEHRINIGVLSETDKFGEIYTGELLTYFLRQNGVSIKNGIEFITVPDNATHIYRHFSSFTLKEIIKSLLEHSNNFITNQIGLHISGRNISPPANQKKSIEILYNFFKKYHTDLLEMELYEFSGISWDNQLAANDMIKILHYFEPYKNLLPEKDNFYHKTGTLTNVRTIAGYLTAKNQKEYKIVLILNDNVNNYNRIVNIIKHELNNL